MSEIRRGEKKHHPPSFEAKIIAYTIRADIIKFKWPTGHLPTWNSSKIPVYTLFCR